MVVNQDTLLKIIASLDNIYASAKEKDSKKEDFIIYEISKFLQSMPEDIEIYKATKDYSYLKSGSCKFLSYDEICNVNTAIANINNKDYINKLSEAIGIGVNSRGESSISFKLDGDGSLLIQNKGNVNLMQIYNNSHRLLKLYDETNDINGMKYELCMLWYMITLLENDVIYNKNRIKEIFITNKKREEAFKTRAFIISDFNKYLKMVIKRERGFNFYEFYKKSPFYAETYKIDKRLIHTLLPF